MDAQWLVSGGLPGRLLAMALVLAPALFIVCSRRAGWLKKILWTVASQLSWVFILIYAWVWRERYGDATASLAGQFPGSPIAEAMGWWTLAFPWAIYLLYRATRSWFPGEQRPGAPR